MAYNHGTRKYPAKWRGLWIIFKNFHERVSFSNSNRQYCASRLRNWPAQDGTVSRGKGAYLWPRTCSQLPVPGAWNNCIISVEAAATNPARRGRQTTPTYPPPLTFYLSSSILTRRFLRFDLALPPRSPGWNYVAWNFDKTGEDSGRAGIRLNLSSYSPRGRKEETFRNGWLRDSKATCVRCPATCTHLLFETSLSLSLYFAFPLWIFLCLPL